MQMPLTVGQFVDSYYPAVDGVIMAVRNYAYWLNKAYGACYVAAPEYPKYDDNEPFEVLRYASIPITGRPPYRFGLPVLDARFHRQIRHIDFDIVHAHSPFTAGLSAYNIARRRDIPLVATFHSKYYDDLKQSLKSDKVAKLVGIQYVVNYLRRADSVWTVNEATVETMRAYGYKGRVDVIPNGTDLCYPMDAEEIRAKTRAKYGIPADMPLYIFVGQMIFQKNLRMVLEAAKLLLDDGQDFRMLLVGEGYAQEDLQSYSHEIGISGRVTFTGAVRDREALNAIYLSSDALVFPSLYDNAPLVVREASSLRVPSILVRGANAADGVFDGENGLLCDNDPASLREAMKRAIDREDMQKIGKRASETLSQSWEQIVGEVHDRYLDIIADYKTGQRKKRARIANIGQPIRIRWGDVFDPKNSPDYAPRSHLKTRKSKSAQS